MERAEPRGRDGFGWGHVEIDRVDEQVEHGLVLAIATCDAECEGGIFTFEDECRCQGDARSLARLNAVGMSGCGVEAAETVSVGDPCLSAIHAAAIDIGARCGGDHVAPAICDDAGGCAVSTRSEYAVFGYGFHFVGVTGTRLEGRRFPVDQSASHVRILVGQQDVERYLDEFGVSVIGVAISKGQLQGFHREMDAVRGEVFHFLYVEPFDEP